MAGICFQFIVDINFCTNKCVTKNAVCVLNGQHFFFFSLLFSSKGVNLKKVGKVSFYLKYALQFLNYKGTI